MQKPYCLGGKHLFEMVSLRLNYPFIRRSVGRVLSLFANIWPFFWDYFGFPIDEIECRVRKLEVLRAEDSPQ